MKIRIAAVGKLRRGPEAELIDDYVLRFNRTGRALGLGPLEIVEVEDRKGGKQHVEAELLARAIPDGAFVIALDERGEILASPKFALKTKTWQEIGHRNAVFLIGGADGLSDEIRTRADFLLSLGKMVWPHMLARVMLTEQLYRATTILSGGPYHRA